MRTLLATCVVLTILMPFSIAGSGCSAPNSLDSLNNESIDALEQPLCTTNGLGNTCGPGCRCAMGWGDCDANQDCAAGLACGADNGALFGMPALFDVCTLPHCANGILDTALGETGIDRGGECGGCPANGVANTCSAACPCPEGWGDCDSNQECQPGLVCVNDAGAKHGLRASLDVCERPAPVCNGTSPGQCSGGSCSCNAPFVPAIDNDHLCDVVMGNFYGAPWPRCVNAARDAWSCGTPGMLCGGSIDNLTNPTGWCDNGTCRTFSEVTFISGVSSLRGPLIHDAGTLFYVANGGINAANTQTGAVTVLAGAEQNPRALRIDADHVYWAAGSPVQLRRVPRAGGAAQTIATPQAPDILAENATDVFFVQTTEDEWDTRGEVMAAPKNGDAPRVVWVTPLQTDGFDFQYDRVRKIVATDSFLFIGTLIGLTAGFSDSLPRHQTVRLRASDGADSGVVSGTGPTLNGDDLYVITSSSSIFRMPAFTSVFPQGPVVITQDCGYGGVGSEMAFDAAAVYAGFVRIPRCPSDVITYLGAVASGPIAVDASYLYFARSGAIGRIPK
jgi:hypothetical protein